VSTNRPRPSLKKIGGKTVLVPAGSDRPIHLIPNVRLNTASDIVAYLEEHFQPSCIGVHEREVDAHRRAGEVGLAQRLIATIRFSQEHRGEEDLED